jgi:hypothetical protein
MKPPLFPPIDGEIEPTTMKPPLFPPIDGEIEPTCEERYAAAIEANYRSDLAAQERRYRWVAEREEARRKVAEANRFKPERTTP